MKVKPVLGDWEIPRVATIQSLERRDFVELPVPGRVGSLFQDLNSGPVRLSLSGSLFGDEARDAFLEEIRAKYRAGEPVTFVADITTATEVSYVIIESLHFGENAALPDETAFHMILRESPPPPPPDSFGLDAGLPDLGAGFLDALSGALGAIDGLGSIPDVGDPTPPLRGAVDGIAKATDGLGDALSPLTAIFGDGQE